MTYDYRLMIYQLITKKMEVKCHLIWWRGEEKPKSFQEIMNNATRLPNYQ